MKWLRNSLLYRMTVSFTVWEILGIVAFVVVVNLVWPAVPTWFFAVAGVVAGAVAGFWDRLTKRHRSERPSRQAGHAPRPR